MSTLDPSPGSDVRSEVISALQSLSDPVYQQHVWGRLESGLDYFDDLSLNLRTLYDVSRVLPEPTNAVPAVLVPAEAPAFGHLQSVLGPLVYAMRGRPDRDYLAHSHWPLVVRAAGEALRAMGVPSVSVGRA